MSAGATRLIECGPGKVLTGLNRRVEKNRDIKMMAIEGSYVGTLEDLKELLALVRAGKVPPIPIETRPADQASAALSDLKSGGKVRGRVVLRHQ